MNFVWFHWAILGVALVVAELVVPAFVLIWFGLGALVVAALLAVAPSTDFIVQLLVWGAASIAFVFLWFRVFKQHLHKTLSGQTASTLGEVGLLVEDIEPFRKAHVRFQTPLAGSDVWECVADKPIKAGQRVRVLSVEGSILKIEEASS